MVPFASSTGLQNSRAHSRHVAVVGAPHQQWGETVVAFVSVTEGAVVTVDAVRGHAATKLARYKLPQQPRIVERLPRNASGKLDKRALRAMVAATSY